MDDAMTQLLEHLDRENPGELIGVYLYGSAVAGGLQRDSDVDVLALTQRSLTTAERESLVALLLRVSGWRGHAGRFPDAAVRRPIELTVLVIDGAEPWAHQPRYDFQYGEWMRGDLVGGHLPGPTPDPDVVVLLASALSHHRILRGRPSGR